nr:hypothetical protein [Janthinobacterium agaricidamnosum]
MLAQHTGCRQAKTAVGFQPAAAILQPPRNIHRCLLGSRLNEAATAVIQRTCLHSQMPGQRRRLAVVHCVSRERKVAIAGYLSTLICQRGGMNSKGTRARMFDLAACIDQRRHIHGQVVAIGGNPSSTIIELTRQTKRKVAFAKLQNLAPHIRYVMRSNTHLSARCLRTIGTQ